MSVSEPAARPAVMHDVARLAGVSRQTVSRVLNGRPNVRQATRDRVPPEAAFLTPSLTTVHQDFDEVGRRGLGPLMDIIDTDLERSAPTGRVPATLIPRRSSAAPQVAGQAVTAV